MTAIKPMTGEQLDELMTVAVNMQRDSEKSGDRPTAMFAYAVQVAVLDLRKVRNDAAKIPETSMSIARYWISPNGIACEDNEGKFVRYEDYAALEARCAALAAENAGLKSAIDSTIGWQQSTDPENVESVRMLVDINTPATDAFLDEVWASGVEMMAAEADQLMSEFGDDNYKVMVTADLQRFANAFAAQIRKGVQS